MSRVSAYECGGLIFDADFDSGNIESVEARGSHQFTLYTRADAIGSRERNRATWFYFAVRGAPPGMLLFFEIRNMNPQRALYQQDMRPVVRSLPSQPDWQRIRTPCQQAAGKDTHEFAITFARSSGATRRCILHSATLRATPSARHAWRGWMPSSGCPRRR